MCVRELTTEGKMELRVGIQGGSDPESLDRGFDVTFGQCGVGYGRI